MSLISYERWAKAVGGGVIGSGVWIGFVSLAPNRMLWTTAVGSLERHHDSQHFILHRRGSGARKIRRILRRAEQAESHERRQRTAARVRKAKQAAKARGGNLAEQRQAMFKAVYDDGYLLRFDSFIAAVRESPLGATFNREDE